MGAMVELSGETEAERKERKRLKKLAKLAKAAAASENASESVPTDASSDADTSSASTLSKKEKKKLKKDKNKNIATLNGSCDVPMVVNGVEEKENGGKKNKKRKHENAVQDDVNETLIEFFEKQDRSNDSPKKKKKKKKTQDDDEPVAKKVKKEKEEMKVKEEKWEPKKEKEEKKVKEEKWEPEQKGVFRKIFYRPTESTINLPDEEVTKFRTENHMNITGRLAELFKPVRSFEDYCTDKKMVKLFVGNLTGDDTSEDIRDVFSKIGSIKDCEKLDQKPYAFVHMEDYSDARRAVKELHGTSRNGKRLRVEISSSKPCKIFLGNLNIATTGEDLRAIFEDRGLTVVEADVVEGKRFGFVHAESTNGFRDINRAVRDLNGYNLKGNNIRVEISEGKKQDDSGYDDYGDYGRGGREGHSGGRGLRGGRNERDSRWRGEPYPSQQYGGGGEVWEQPGSSAPFGRGGGSWMPGGQGSFTPKMLGNRGESYGFQTGALVPVPMSPMMGSQMTQVQQVVKKQNTEEKLQKYRAEMFQVSASALLPMLETGQFSDYQLVCESTNIRVHKVILASKSAGFKSMISAYPTMGMVNDMDSTTLQTLVQFIYGGFVNLSNLNPASIMKLLTAAEKYQVEMVKEGLEAALIKNMTINSVVDFLIISEELQLAELKDVAKNFICDRAKEMKEREDFRVKLREYPHLMIELFDAAAN